MASEGKKLDKTESNFINIAAHQLRIPLTSLRWFSEMLLNGDVGALTPQQKEVMVQISKSTERMISLVNLLLQIARVESGRVRIEPVPLNLKTTTQEVILELKSVLDAKGQKVVVSTNPENLTTIPIDYDVIWQVIQNLIDNASRYSKPGDTIYVSINVKEGVVDYSVKDQGIGIPKGEQGRIFEKFFRASNALKVSPEGSGLGLSLVKSLVESWKGKLWFESEEGKGTTFFFTIPLEGMEPSQGEVKLRV